MIYKDIYEQGELRHVEDENGNRQGLSSTRIHTQHEKREHAIARLETLHNCRNCVNCYRCFNCQGCERCRHCDYCNMCHQLVDCRRCVWCLFCESCNDCQLCYRRRYAHFEKYRYIHSGASISVSRPKLIAADLRVDSIHQRIYEVASQPNALDMCCWHKSCGTAHCRAGWAIELAGHKGYFLEQATSPAFAAMVIYDKNSKIPMSEVPNFSASNAEALADMKRMAELEQEFELQQKGSEQC